MQLLTPDGQRRVNELANKYQLSVDAVMTLMQALIDGNGTMAQFNHRELGGSGQWMQGGMIMVGDMFNNNLKALIGNLCYELNQLLATYPFDTRMPTIQSQASGNQFQQQGSQAQSSGGFGSISSWWPAELGMSTFAGGQNNCRYAYFADKHRLAMEQNGHVIVYDTLDHQIGGTSQQQQGGVASVTFTSQYGIINLQDLPVVSGGSDFKPAESTRSTAAPQTSGTEQDIFAKIERLAELKQKGVLSEEEFATKKAELLARL